MERFPLIKRSPSPLVLIKSVAESIAYRRNPGAYRPVAIKAPFSLDKVDFRDLRRKGQGPADTRAVSAASGDLIGAVRQAGIRGMGGGAFLAADKISAAAGARREAKVLIINAVECDPGLVHDDWIARHFGGEVCDAAGAVAQAAGISRIVFAVKKGTRLELPPWVEIHQTAWSYPAGEERRLIRAITGMDPEDDGPPAEQGVLVMNIQTLLRIKREVLQGETPSLRYFTYLDLDARRASVVVAEEGRPLDELAETLCPDAEQLYTGGGAMQSRSIRAEEGLSAEVNALIRGRKPHFSDKACKGCLQCAVHCPAGLRPDKILEAQRNGEVPAEGDPRLDASRCLDCGCCSYLCPAGIELCSVLQRSRGEAAAPAGG